MSTPGKKRENSKDRANLEQRWKKMQRGARSLVPFAETTAGGCLDNDALAGF